MCYTPYGRDLSQHAPIHPHIYSVAAGEYQWSSNQTAKVDHVHFRASTETVKQYSKCPPLAREWLWNLCHSWPQLCAPAPSCCTLVAHTAAHPLVRRCWDAQASHSAWAATRCTRASMHSVDGQTAGSAAARSAMVSCTESTDCRESDAKKPLMCHTNGFWCS